MSRVVVLLVLGILWPRTSPLIAQDPPTPGTKPASLPPGDDDPPAPDPTARKQDEPLPDEDDFLNLEEIDTSELAPFTFHGVLDLTYVHVGSEENANEFETDQVLPLHPMLMLGYRLHPRLQTFLELEWEGTEVEFEVEQAYVEWTAVEDLLLVGIGRHALPFGVFRLSHSPSRNDLVDEPAAFHAVYPEVNPDLGVFARGEYAAQEFSIGYELSVSNGLHGPTRQAAWGDFSDNNDSKTLTGRLSFAPADNITLGVSYASGQYDHDDKLLIEYQGFDLQYRINEIHLRAEWFGGLVERSTAGGGDYHRHGWYVELMRPWPVDLSYLQEVETVLRYDNMDANNKTRDYLDMRRYSFGINLVPTEHLRWKLEYQITDERYDEIANDGFLTQVEYHW